MISMKSNIRKLILLGVSVITLLITSVTFTFAWLSTNIATYVTNIELDVDVSDGIEISTDGVNFSSKISEDKIKEAIVVKYLGYSYSNEGAVIDADGNLINLTSKMVDEYFKNISFKPVTTNDGKKFYKDKYNLAPTSVKSGELISLDLYFKAIDRGVDVYFNTSNFNFDADGKLMKKFQISGESKKTSSDISKTDYLVADLVTVDSNGDPLNYKQGQVGLEINGKDAMRFTAVVDETTRFYEPNIGLGSYATNLDSKKYESLYKEASMYDSSKNASFTYVNNQKKEFEKFQALDYNSIPETFKGFETVEGGKLLNLENVGAVKKATFTFWLEGWDADCFDTIIGSNMIISMAFTTNKGTLYEKAKKINYHYSNKVKTYTYYDYGDIQYIYLPPNDDNKIFDGWYSNENLTGERFDFTIVDDTVEDTFDVFAKWK